jgi:hypothetical protein
VELVGVGEQMPPGAGAFAQGVPQLGVGVLVPRPAAHRGRDDPELAAGALHLVASLRLDVLGEVEGQVEPLDAEGAVVVTQAVSRAGSTGPTTAWHGHRRPADRHRPSGSRNVLAATTTVVPSQHPSPEGWEPSHRGGD